MPQVKEEPKKKDHPHGVWAAVMEHYGRFKNALNMTGLSVTIQAPGLIVYESHVGEYDDGRSGTVFVGHEPETLDPVVFIPTVDRKE